MDPPNSSTFLIKGYLINNKEDISSIVEGLKVPIQGLDNPKEFQIVIRKNKTDYSIKHYPDELKLLKVGDDINLHKIKIIHSKYLITRVGFTKANITDEELLNL